VARRCSVMMSSKSSAWGAFFFLALAGMFLTLLMIYCCGKADRFVGSAIASSSHCPTRQQKGEEKGGRT
jgi:hypothetical protein